MTRKDCADIKTGDVILFGGTPHLVTEIEPYTHPTLGPTAGIAKDGTGWCITLFAGTDLDVAA